MCVFCPLSLILPLLVKNKPSNYDVPYQAILSSFFSFSTIKAKVYVVIKVINVSNEMYTFWGLKVFLLLTLHVSGQLNPSSGVHCTCYAELCNHMFTYYASCVGVLTGLFDCFSVFGGACKKQQQTENK
jgi:hypothetical protein